MAGISPHLRANNSTSPEELEKLAKDEDKTVRRWVAANPNAPASLLEKLAADYGRRGPAQRLASNRLTQFNEARIEDIFQSGLHEYIQGFLNENNALGAAIHEQYLV